MSVQLVKFMKVKASCQLVHHSFQGKKTCNDLKGEEEGKDDVDCTLQWLDLQTLIKEQEEN